MTVKIALKKKVQQERHHLLLYRIRKERHLQDHPGRRDHGDGL